ncbi:MAG: hypothetical protein NT062_04040 [Proteobacteria bacterium]|nr:hypothetical protein [Pseudomonadota bacterium]
MRFQLALLLCGFVAACGDDGNSTGIAAECNPLGGEGCLLPWPSMTYEKADPDTWSKFRVDLPLAGMPRNYDKVSVSPDPLNRIDGFSPTGAMLAQFATGVATDNLPHMANPDESLAATSPIVVMDVDTGKRAAFFAEVDENQSDPTKRALIIRPLERLNERAHYVVAIRNTVRAPDGGDVTVSPGFAALRDGTDFAHQRFVAIKARFESGIFDKLEAAGVHRDELVLAWDFVTASDASLRSDLTEMRAQALPAMGTDGSALTFTTVVKPNSPSASRPSRCRARRSSSATACSAPPRATWATSSSRSSRTSAASSSSPATSSASPSASSRSRRSRSTT